VKIERKAKPRRERSGRASARVSRAKSGARAGAERPKESASMLSRAALLIMGALRRPVLAGALLFLGFVALAAMFVGGFVGRGVHALERGVDGLAADAGFGIAEVHIAGNSRTPPEMLSAALGLEPGQSIFGADLRAARARVMALDWVADAEVKRRYPDAIFVRIVEKLPFAVWQSPDGIYVVERSGGVITNKDVDQFAKLPKLAGLGGNKASDIVDAVALHRAVFARTGVIERVSDRRWNLHFDDGVLVKLPETGWQQELDTLEHLIVDKDILGRDIVEIDLRSPQRIYFVLRSGAKGEEPRGKAI
jgi:cell division protein FtsQ